MAKMIEIIKNKYGLKSGQSTIDAILQLVHIRKTNWNTTKIYLDL